MALFPSSRRFVLRQPSVIPGFGLTFGVALTMLTLIVLIPLAGLGVRAASLGFGGIVALASEPRILASLKTSFSTALIAALIDVVFGTIAAWVLVRYRFWGRRIIDALIDLPFAMPTAVAGIALTTIYAPNGLIGQFLTPLGIRIAYTPAGIVVALIAVGFPFVVRSVQPLIEELSREREEVSATLGARRWQTLVFVILPELLPAVLTGFALALARGIGEYGSVIFIAGNLPFKSEIAPLLIVIRLEEFNYPAATAIAAIMLSLSFLLLFIINALQGWSQRRFGHG
ncbi:sulfate ABC transporter permease subunit CysT [Allorhizobium sp. BGMRC 0089]|uniref:sulfate ABC transporter permease subunit CysT n=1 Tax=Allorhizobium sonneratiae TaxID=2934936 RepID=UPI002033F6CE|nr:sulfate ABC transporter permease subunit CysT [Allorhizobium sonneratiae]MCM2292468.1 sulfate ABC transporter permease subunit CysT [Allorhizobium sonneratiae]